MTQPSDKGAIRHTESALTRKGATAAGAAGGTALVALASLLPANSLWRFWLTLAAPTLSVISGIAWFWFLAEGANYVRNWKFYRLHRRAEKALQKIIASRATSDQGREHARLALEKLRLAPVQRDLDAIDKLMSDVTIADVRAAHQQSNT